MLTFCNDNSLFTGNNNSSFKIGVNFLHNPDEEKHFNLVFENSFKFGEKEVLEEITESCLFINEDSSKSKSSNENTRKNSCERMFDVYEQFLGNKV
jgi:hypothetical protein